MSDSVYYSSIVGISGLADSISFSPIYISQDSAFADSTQSFSVDFNIEAQTLINSSRSTVSFVGLGVDSASYTSFETNLSSVVIGGGSQPITASFRFTSPSTGQAQVAPTQVWIG